MSVGGGVVAGLAFEEAGDFGEAGVGVGGVVVGDEGEEGFGVGGGEGFVDAVGLFV